MSVNQIMEFIENLDKEESSALLFSMINALINCDDTTVEKLKEHIKQMINDDSNPNIIRLY